jgi:glycosyltransferase involved in cell wall biosynthesis
MPKGTVGLFLLNLGAGGVERVISTLLPEFSRQGLSYIVICLYDSEPFYSIPRDCKVFSLRDLFDTRFLGAPSWMFHILAPFILNRLLTNEDIDCVQSFLPLPNLINIIASKLTTRKRRISLSERCTPIELIERSKWLLKAIYYFAIRYAYGCSDNIIAISSGIKNDLVKLGVSEEKIAVIYNPISPHDDCGDRSQKEVEVAKYRYFLCVGRHEPQKGFDIAIKTFRLLISSNQDLATYRLVIVGKGSCSKDLVTLVDRLDLNGQVIFIEKSTRIHALMAGAEMFWFPSRFEGFGNVLVEALSSGVLICSTDCRHGPAEILTSYKGWLAKPDSVYSFYANCCTLLALDESERKFLIEEAKASLERFSLTLIASSYIECIFPAKE